LDGDFIILEVFGEGLWKGLLFVYDGWLLELCVKMLMLMFGFIDDTSVVLVLVRCVV